MMRSFKVSFMTHGEHEEKDPGFKPGFWVFTKSRIELPRWVINHMEKEPTYEYRRFGEFNEYIFNVKINEEVIETLFGEAHVCW